MGTPSRLLVSQLLPCLLMLLMCRCCSGSGCSPPPPPIERWCSLEDWEAVDPSGSAAGSFITSFLPLPLRLKSDRMLDGMVVYVLVLVLPALSLSILSILALGCAEILFASLLAPTINNPTDDYLGMPWSWFMVV